MALATYELRILQTGISSNNLQIAFAFVMFPSQQPSCGAVCMRDPSLTEERGQRKCQRTCIDKGLGGNIFH